MTASNRAETDNARITVWKPDWRAWVIFTATFIVLHLAFCAFILFRHLVSGENADAGGVFGFILLLLSGVLTSVESAVGFAVVDSIVSMGRACSRRVQRLSAALGGAAAYVLVWVVLALRVQVPNLYENVAGSILNLNLNGAFPWGAMLLGGVTALAVKSGAMGLIWAKRIRGAVPNQDA